LQSALFVHLIFSIFVLWNNSMKMDDLFQQITYKKMFGEYGQLLIF